MTTNRRRVKRYDPSRTTSLRLAYERSLRRRLQAFKRAVVQLVLTDDAFGLGMSLNVAHAFAFATDAGKVTEFNSWMQRQIDDGILAVDDSKKYIESSYRKGRVRAYIDSDRVGLTERVPGLDMTRREFLESAFLQPVAASKVELLYTRAYGELKGVTDSMSQILSRTLAQGIADGKSPLSVAAEMRKQIDGLEVRRARTIARTEIIRAHAEGQLDEFDELGIEELGLQAEWVTAGDDRVCPECETMEARTFTVAEARGLIPLHPNCRCIWIPNGLRTTAPVPVAPDWVTASDPAPALEHPELPAWAQGKGAPNPKFGSADAALESLKSFNETTMLRSSFPGGVDISGATRKIVTKSVEVPIDKLYHSIQGDVDVRGVRIYLDKLASGKKITKIEVLFNESDGTYMIVQGHHRAEAFRAAGRKTILADVKSKIPLP